MLKSFAAALVALIVGGCAVGPAPTPTGPIVVTPPPQAAEGPRPFPAAAAEYGVAATRISSVATAMCRDANPDRPPRHCAFDLRLVDDPRIGANAFQTRRRDGSPVVAMTVQLVAETRNADEIAFILGHEAAHHIADHIQRTQNQALAGALVLGALANLGNASDETIREMMDLGASLGGRAYSQSYEMEADMLGAYIAARAGYDPERGARIFARPVLGGGGGLLATHPASAQRQARVAATAAEIRRQQALGLTPSPAASIRAF